MKIMFMLLTLTLSLACPAGTGLINNEDKEKQIELNSDKFGIYLSIIEKLLVSHSWTEESEFIYCISIAGKKNLHYTDPLIEKLQELHKNRIFINSEKIEKDGTDNFKDKKTGRKYLFLRIGPPEVNDKKALISAYSVFGSLGGNFFDYKLEKDENGNWIIVEEKLAGHI